MLIYALAAVLLIAKLFPETPSGKLLHRLLAAMTANAARSTPRRGPRAAWWMGRQCTGDQSAPPPPLPAARGPLRGVDLAAMTANAASRASNINRRPASPIFPPWLPTRPKSVATVNQIELERQVGD